MDDIDRNIMNALIAGPVKPAEIAEAIGWPERSTVIELERLKGLGVD